LHIDVDDLQGVRPPLGDVALQRGDAVDDAIFHRDSRHQELDGRLRRLILQSVDEPSRVPVSRRRHEASDPFARRATRRCEGYSDGEADAVARVRTHE
jgi:hypothetical protein